jgi:hypothetical protein
MRDTFRLSIDTLYTSTTAAELSKACDKVARAWRISFASVSRRGSALFRVLTARCCGSETVSQASMVYASMWLRPVTLATKGIEDEDTSNRAERFVVHETDVMMQVFVILLTT